MNSFAHWLSLLSAVHHLAVGMPELLKLGPRFLPASWALIFGWLGEVFWWLWPGLYVVTGVVAAVGVRRTDMLRLGLWLSALIHFIWGSVSIYGWLSSQGGTLPGSFTFLFLSGVLWVVAHYVRLGERGDQINEKVAALGEQVFQIEEQRRADEVNANG